MMEAMSRNKDACKAMCRNSTEENWNHCESMENKAKEFSKAIGRRGVLLRL